MKQLAAFLFILSFCTAYAQQVKSTGLVQLLPQFNASIELNDTDVTLFMSGPSDRWFAIGFNSVNMASGTDCVYFANGNSGVTLYDARLVGNAAPVADAIQDWEVLSNEITAGPSPRREITARRALNTGNAQDYAFSLALQSLNIVFAHGSTTSNNLAYHSGNRGTALVQFSDVTSTADATPFENTVALYPNPTQGELNVCIATGAPVRAVRIFDAQARLVASFSFGGSDLVTFALPQLSAGLYFAEVSTDEHKALKRFVVEH
jgi:hypothetical protein